MSFDAEFEANKKKILDEQEKDFAKDKESSEPLLLTDELRAEGIEMISYSKKYLYVEDCNGHSVHVDLVKDSISRTLEYFDSLVNGSFNDSLKKSIKLFLYQNWKDIGTEFQSKSKKEKDEDQDKTTKAELALEKAKEVCKKTFVDEYRIAHASIEVNEHSEVIPIESKRFRDLVRSLVYKENKIVIDTQTLKDTLAILSAEAQFSGEKAIKLNLRTASIDSKWYYDLTNEHWDFIEITSEGWKVVNNLIMFRRFTNQLPQVTPSKTYDLNVFDRLIKLLLDVNVDMEKKDDYQLLLKCYIIFLFIPDLLKPVLMPHGRQGGAKSTLLESIKMIVDPSILKTLSFPRDKNELIQQLSHNYVAFYDNISRLQEWSSDEICRAVTGSGSSKRKLYSDDDDIIYNFKRCVGFNGINMAASKADLLDRGLNIEVKRIEDKDYRPPEDINKEFEELISQALGYIFDILVKVLKWKQDCKPLIGLRFKRMADFAKYGEIISRCMDNPDNAFIKAYETNIKTQVQEIIESSPVADCVVYWFNNIWLNPDENKTAEGQRQQKIIDEKTKDWSGTASQLLEILEGAAITLKINTKSKSWPKAPNILSRKLNEVATSLKDIGIEVEFISSDRGATRLIIIRKVSSSSSSSSSSQNQAQDQPKNDDDIISEAKHRNQVSSSENDQNRAQNDDDYDDYDDYDTLQTIKEEQERPEECPNCHRMIESFDKNTHPACCQGKGV